MNCPRYRVVSLGLLLLLIAGAASPSQAQSGRRQAKPPPAAPIPTPAPEPTPEPKKEQKQTELGFIIGSDSSAAFQSFPLGYYDAAMTGCAERLRSGSSAVVSVAQNQMNRGEAIKKAKAEKTSYVVLMRLVIDELTARSYDDMEIDFVVFAPQTAKVVISGRSYLTGNRKGPIVVGPSSRGSSSVLYREQMIKRAGEAAGDRILKALHLDVPVLK